MESPGLWRGGQDRDEGDRVTGVVKEQGERVQEVWGVGEVGTRGTDLVQDVLVEVGHVALAGHRAVIVITEVLLEGHRVMGYVQHRVQIVRQHLRQSRYLLPVPWIPQPP